VKILFVTSMHPTKCNPSRGINIIRIKEEIRKLGCNVDTFELGERGGPLRYVTARGRVAKVLADSRPDVVHVHFGYSGLAVPRLQAPLVTSFYGDDLNGTFSVRGGTTVKSKVGIAISQLVAARSRRCIVVSSALRRRLWWPALRSKTRVIRDAVDPSVFGPIAQHEARLRFGLPMSSKLVLFPHDVSQPTKRVELARAAVEMMRAWAPEARLWIVNGKPPAEMPWYYAAADVMIVTSAFEGGPSSTKEALACGIPVVSVAVGDTALFAEAPDAMVRAEPTPAGLADALHRAMDLARLPRRSHLPEELLLPNAVRAILDVYSEALG
jgi:glycosyl transferase family 4/glycosyl transferase family 1